MSETINFVTNTLKGVGREPDCQPSGSVICYLSEDDAKCLMATDRDGGLSTVCHCCRFSWQQTVQKTFLTPSYMCFEDGVV